MKVSSETNSIKQDESVPFFFLFFLVQVEGNLLSEKKDEIRSMESLRSFKVANAVVLTTFLVDNLSLFVFKQLSAVSFCQARSLIFWISLSSLLLVQFCLIRVSLVRRFGRYLICSFLISLIHPTLFIQTKFLLGHGTYPMSFCELKLYIVCMPHVDSNISDYVKFGVVNSQQSHRFSRVL